MRHDLPEIHPELMKATRPPTSAELQTLLESYNKDGWRDPILTATIDGTVYAVDGHSRIILLRKNDAIPAPPFRHLGNLSLEAARYLVCEYTLTRKHFSADERAKVIAVKAARRMAEPDAPSKNSVAKEVAADLGVSVSTVKADMLKAERERQAADQPAKPKQPEKKAEHRPDIHPSVKQIGLDAKDLGEICIKINMQLDAMREISDTIPGLRDAAEEVRSVMVGITKLRPYAICPMLPSQGLCSGRCPCCAGRNYVTQVRWTLLTDDERKLIKKREGLFGG